jgi:hypothetical protein
MIDVSSEQVMRLSEAAASLPPCRAGKRRSLSCVYRWTVPPGCRGVVLESVQIGATRCTSREALERFFSALTEAAKGNPLPPPPPSKARRRAMDAATKRLAQSGL